MKDLIKVLIALFSIGVAFYIGQYYGNEKCNEDTSKLNNKIFVLEESKQKLRDSIIILLKTQVVVSKDTTILEKARSKKRS
ncbi:MAG: hypothetical protein JSR71_13240 [Proteobacteria bacterium]|nr:hypothetical protein [Pseudomonadota bacterium]